MISFEHACGLRDTHIDFHSLEVPVHCELVAPLQNLKKTAAAAGLELAIASGYRSFAQQENIWNAKACGQRPILDDNSQCVPIENLSETEIVFAILRWSALPGTSRHHWGSDVDVVDGAVVKKGYQPKLVVEETFADGEFADLHHWLNGYLADDDKYFFRPYAIKTGLGVSPEPWHLSYRPLATNYSKSLKKELLEEQIKNSGLLLKDAILNNFNKIFHYFFQQYI